MSQGSAHEVQVDLSDEQFGVGIPFETFAALRATQPVYWYERGNCWVVTSYEHVEAINRDPRRFSSAGGPIPPDDPGHPELPIMLADDPPVHTVYRRMVNKDWTPRSVAAHGGPTPARRCARAGKSRATSANCSPTTASTRATTWPAWSSPWRKTENRWTNGSYEIS
jgi:cytochrome P450